MCERLQSRLVCRSDCASCPRRPLVDSPCIHSCSSMLWATMPEFVLHLSNRRNAEQRREGLMHEARRSHWKLASQSNVQVTLQPSWPSGPCCCRHAQLSLFFTCLSVVPSIRGP